MKMLLVPLVSLSFFADTAKPEVSHTYRGIYTHGFEVSAFMPCGGTRDYWLWAKEEKLLDKLDAHMNEIRDKNEEPYPSVYVEIVAVDIGKSDEGFPADYDATLDMKKLIRYSQNIPCDCKPSS